MSFLALFALGGGVGLLTTAQLVTLLLSTAAELPLRFAFLGAAFGCIPPMMKQAELSPLNGKKLMWVAVGILAAAVVSLLPQSQLLPEMTAKTVLIEGLSGVTVAAALVLPGISASQMLYMLGMYEPLMQRIADCEFVALIPFVIGVLSGIYLTAKITAALLERWEYTNHVILGFMLYSILQMIPPVADSSHLFIGFVCTAIGFAIATLCTKKE